MNKMNMPNGWTSATVGDLADYVNGRAFKPTEWKNTGKPIIRIQNLNKNDAKYNFSSESHEAKYLVRNGDLLFAWSASLGAYIWHGGDAWLNQHIFLVLPKNCTTKLFIFYLLEKITAELYAKAHGSGMVHVTKGKFESTEISLPPLPEQRRIVAKIEELFSELDKGIENLKIARAQLKVYRQALLKYAFEGKLTAQWREQNSDKLESAEALLQRIQLERAERYQQQLADWQANGGSKPKAPKYLPPLTADELAELPELPEGWGWVKVDSYCDAGRNSIKAGPFGSSLKKGFYVKEGYKVYGQEQVISGDWKYGDYFIDEARYIDLESCKVKSFDILISLVGTLGKVLVLPENITPGVINPRLVKISPNLNTVVPEFFKYYFESSFLKGLYKLKTHGATMDVLNLGIIQELPFPICSLKEQKILIQEIEARLSEVEQLELTLVTSLQQAEALRQSILKKAFSGQLVPQDPDDEPASVLLARIKAETAAQPNIKKVRT